MFANKEKIESFIGRNSKFKGDISTKGTVRVDGSVTGNIEADWVVLGEKSYMKGHLKSSGVDISGTLEGTITAKESVEIRRQGRVKGDISTAKLSVAEGGLIDGKIMMNRDGSNVIELSTDKLNNKEA